MKIKLILYTYHSDLLELFLATQLFLFGLWVLNPWVDTFESSKSYLLMAQFPSPNSRLNEYLWGLTMAVTAGLHLWSLFRDKHKLHRYSLVVSLFFWTTVAIAFLAVNAAAVGGAQFALTALVCAFVLWRNGK
jgi:hypothetical protein